MIKNILKYGAVALGLLLIWKFAWDYLQFHSDAPIRAVGDIWDLRVYYNNGKWFPQHLQPYVDVPSEYPQIATYLFGLMHWFSRNASRPGIGREIYFHTFSLLMVVLAWVNFILLSHMRESKKWLALLLFLPGALYYTLYRFDVLPAFLCLLAIFLIRKRYWVLAAILLGIATLTKWYAILLIPPLLSYYWSVERKLPWKPMLAYLAVCLLIIAPTFWAGGLDALLAPYQYHAARGIEEASLPGYLNVLSGGVFLSRALVLLFLGLEVFFSAFSFFTIIDSGQKFENWATLIIGCFVLFSRIFSPQWILWILPLLLLRANKGIEIALICIYGFMVYLSFPIAYDLKSSFLPLINVLGLLPLLILMVEYIRRIDWKFAYPFLVSKSIDASQS